MAGISKQPGSPRHLAKTAEARERAKAIERGDMREIAQKSDRTRRERADYELSGRAKLAVARAPVVPLEVLLQTMCERWEEALRAKGARRARLQAVACDIAKDAAPYVHSRLQATVVKSDPENPLRFVMELPPAPELKRLVRGATIEAGEA